MACGCNSKKGNKTAQYSNISYVVKDAAGDVVKQFGNRSSAVRTLRNHPGFTLETVES